MKKYFQLKGLLLTCIMLPICLVSNSQEILVERHFAELKSTIASIKEKCDFATNCPDVNQRTAENLAEALAQVQYTLERYKTLTAQGKLTAWRHYTQERSVIIERAGKLHVMESVFAIQDGLHNLSKYSSTIADIVSLGETIASDYLLSEDFTTAFKNGNINWSQARQALNSKLDEFAKGRNQVSEVNDATESAIALFAALKQKFPDAPANPDILSSTEKALKDMNGMFKQVSDVINFEMEMLGKVVASPADIDKLARMKSALRASGLKVVLGPLQDWSEKLRKEMYDRVEESHNLLAEEQKALGAAFRIWQQWNVANGLIAETYADITQTQKLFYNVLSTYIRPISYKSDPGPKFSTDAALQAIQYWNVKFPEQVNKLENVQKDFRINEFLLKPSLKISKKQFLPGENITIEFIARPCYEKKAWIGIIPATIAHNEQEKSFQAKLTSQYLAKKSKGSLQFKAPSKPGSYDFRMFDTEENGREIISTTFSVGAKEEEVVLTDKSMGLLIVHTEISGCSGRDTIAGFEIFQNGSFVTSSSAPNATDQTYAVKPPPYRFELKPGVYDMRMTGGFLPINTTMKIDAGKKTIWSRGEYTGKLEIRLLDKSGTPKKFGNYKIVIGDGTKELLDNYWWDATDRDAGLLPVGRYHVTISFTVPEPYHQETQTRQVDILACNTVTLNFYEDGKVTQYSNKATLNAEPQKPPTSVTESNSAKRAIPWGMVLDREPSQRYINF